MTYPPQPPNDPNQPYGQQPQQPYGQQPQPGQYSDQYGQAPQYQPPVTPQPKPKKKWPWIVGGIVAILVIAAAVGGGKDKDEDKTATSATSTAAVAPLVPQTTNEAVKVTTTTPEPTVVPEVTLPDVAGQNGAIVQDKLEKLGLTNVSFGSADEKDKVVLLLTNWTAVSIEPAPGTIVAGDDLVVVTMTKK
ncbi:hypothetical protein ACFVWF_23565 [Rhodococcus qingshengii]|uniref:hypothetical protein n=1 Tax=Rhodococcus qingshengii TaxID=334542 RepID=UPI0036DDB4E5